MCVCMCIAILAQGAKLAALAHPPTPIISSKTIQMRSTGLRPQATQAHGAWGVHRTWATGHTGTWCLRGPQDPGHRPCRHTVPLESAGLGPQAIRAHCAMGVHRTEATGHSGTRCHWGPQDLGHGPYRHTVPLRSTGPGPQALLAHSALLSMSQQAGCQSPLGAGGTS